MEQYNACRSSPQSLPEQYIRLKACDGVYGSGYLPIKQSKESMNHDDSKQIMPASHTFMYTVQCSNLNSSSSASE